MIYIREIKPLKFSGLSSFLVSFEYDPRIVDLIKTIPNHYFHKNILAWEIPINCLAQTLDLLTPLDTITLTLLEEEPAKENLELTEDEIAQFKIKPFRHQLEAVNFGLKHDGWLLLDSMGCGKALSLDTKIYTPNGFVTMKDLKVGDYVFDETGKPTKVLRIYDHADVEMYEITFSDNQKIKCCKDHLWQISDSSKRPPKVINTDWFLGKDQFGQQRKFKSGDGKYKYRIPLPQPLTFKEQAVPLDPYIMGVILGDGCITHDQVSFVVSTKKAEIAERVSKLLPNGMFLTAIVDKRNANVISYTIHGKDITTRKTARKILTELGLMGKHSHEKFIPKQYLFNSIENRIKLLQGLLDTDGCVTSQNLVSYSTTSPQLRDDVIELTNLLGSVTTCCTKQGAYKDKEGKKHICKLVYELAIRNYHHEDFFYLSTKKNKLHARQLSFNRSIKEVKKIPNSAARCITVDSPSHLYVVENGIVTHNTAEIIYYAETLKRRGLIDHALIICGVDSLRQNWKAEIEKFSSFDVRVLGEYINRNGKIQYNTITERAEELKNPIKEFFVVVNAATLRNEKIIKVLTNKKNPNQFGLIAVDECHRFATKNSLQGANLLKLKAPYKVAASGSIITNGPISAYTTLVFTENDHSTLTNFKSQYCVFGGFGGHEIIGYKNLDLLKDEIDFCSIRRTLQDVRDDMPKKNLDYELVEMSDEHSKFYDAIKTGVKEEADKIELNASNLLALTTRLRQATSCPSALTTQKIMSSKVERCVELTEDILDSGEKVVIMTHFKEPVSVLKDLLKKYKPLIGTGDQSEAETQKNIDEFRNSKDRNLLIGTAQKIGTGFSMPECHYMILLDMPFTAASLSQTTQRIFRINSEQPVFIKILLCKDTIDERVRDIVEEKQDLSDYLIDDKLNNNLSDKLKKVLLEL